MSSVGTSAAGTLFELPGSSIEHREIARTTQGPKYAGSKLKLLPHILDSVREARVARVWDAFSGSTRVSQALARAGYSVESNDSSFMSETLATAFLLNDQPPSHYADLLDHLNGLPAKDGWFTKNYGGQDFGGLAVQPDGTKRLWQVHNTRKLDAIREEIDHLKLDDVSHAVALTSLILALDSVDSSLGHFTSYLRKWSPRSYKEMQLTTPNLLENTGEHTVTRRDVLSTCNPVTPDVDLAYFDPPYGSNNDKMPASRVRYRAYYHVWTSIVLNDQPPVFGAARRRVDSRDTDTPSPFEEFRRNPTSGRFIAVEAIEELLHTADVPWVLLSYSSGGRATRQELMDVLTSAGELVKVSTIDHKRNVMAQMRWTDAWVREEATQNQEFLFLLKKG